MSENEWSDAIKRFKPRDEDEERAAKYTTSGHQRATLAHEFAMIRAETREEDAALCQRRGAILDKMSNATCLNDPKDAKVDWYKSEADSAKDCASAIRLVAARDEVAPIGAMPPA